MMASRNIVARGRGAGETRGNWHGLAEDHTYRVAARTPHNKWKGWQHMHCTIMEKVLIETLKTFLKGDITTLLEDGSTPEIQYTTEKVAA